MVHRWQPPDKEEWVLHSISFSPDYFAKPMAYIGIPFGLVPSNSESDTPPCRDEGILFGSQAVAQSSLFQSFSSNRSSHMIQVQMWCIVLGYGQRP